MNLEPILAYSVFRYFVFATGAFILSMVLTPLLTDILYRYKIGKTIREGRTPIFSTLHESKAGTPTMAGVLIWGVVAIVTLLFNWTRSQTYLPLFVLVSVGLLGAVDDLYNIFKMGVQGGGMRARTKLIWQLLIAALAAWWIFFKLEVVSIYVPFVGDFVIGYWYIPLIIFIIVATTNALNITDGLDGLSGGLSITAFGAFSVLAILQNQISLAIFCATIVGALLAYTWFNIKPARFFMGDTGSMALGATLAIVAVLTNNLLVLPIIGFVFYVEIASSFLQIVYKKITGGRKIFRVAPIHHHFESLGWPETKVTMRFWLIGGVAAAVGIALSLMGKISF